MICIVGKNEKCKGQLKVKENTRSQNKMPFSYCDDVVFPEPQLIVIVSFKIQQSFGPPPPIPDDPNKQEFVKQSHDCNYRPTTARPIRLRALKAA